MYIQSGLFIRIEQLNSAHAPRPLPLDNGFSLDSAYQVLGAFSLSESGEAFLILSNDDDQIWFISNRHCRTHSLQRDEHELRIAL